MIQDLIKATRVKNNKLAHKHKDNFNQVRNSVNGPQNMKK